jgi:predicted Fe-Mo cluster-binding NifX family protein
MNSDERPIIRVAVPSEAPGGLDAARSGQFARSPNFTVVDLVDGSVIDVSVVSNQPHGHGGHLSPVLTLGERQVDVVIVAGIGKQLLLSCLQAGFRVLAGEDRADVRSVIEAFVDADLSPVGPDATFLH